MNKLRIKKLGVLSVAKIYAVIMFVIMLLFSVPLGLFMIVMGLMGAGMAGRDGFAVGGTGVVVGILYMIGIPIIYGIFGFIFGAIGALIYNIFAGMVGGVEIEVENVQSY